MSGTPYMLSDGTVAYDVDFPGDRERREEFLRALIRGTP